MNIEDLKVYELSMDVGEKIWTIGTKWGYFEKDTIGKQLVRAVDSVSANLSEGFGRYHFKKRKISATIQGVPCMKQKHGL